MPPDAAAALDAAIADLFTLDRRAEPAEDLTGYQWAVSIGHGDTVFRDQVVEDFDRLPPV